MPCFMAIDYGLERTGLAISDPEGKLAFPLATLTLAVCGTRLKLIEKLVFLAESNKAEGLVFGLPEYLDGKESPMCAVVRNFAARVKRRLPVPIFFESEILSSEAAAEMLINSGIKRRKIKGNIDQAAACVILEQFLGKFHKTRFGEIKE